MLEAFVSAIKLIYNALITLPRDIKGLIMLHYVEWQFRKNEKDGSSTPKMFEKLVKKHPNKACIIFEETVWSYQDVILILLYATIS
jgi:hypothetical protein